jgi:hypothetical protein
MEKISHQRNKTITQMRDGNLSSRLFAANSGSNHTRFKKKNAGGRSAGVCCG